MSVAARSHAVPFATFAIALALSWSIGAPRSGYSLRQSTSPTGSCTVTIAGPKRLCSDETATFTAKGSEDGDCTWKVVEPATGWSVVTQENCTITYKVDAGTPSGDFKVKVTFTTKGSNPKTCNDTIKGEFEEAIVVPVCVRLLKNSKGKGGTNATPESVALEFEKANQIWERCCIRWKVQEIETVMTDKADDETLAKFISVNPLPDGSSTSPGFEKVNQIGHHTKCVNVMFVKDFSGQGFTIPPTYPAGGGPPTGLGNAGSGVDNQANNNALAHELGHQLNLGHETGNPNSLMSPGASGKQIAGHCEEARKNAKLLLQALAAQ